MLHLRPLIVTFLVIVASCGADQIIAPGSSPPSGRRLAVGETTVCALDENGKVFCWGTNSLQWEYGTDTTTLPSSSSPVAVPIPALTAIAAGVGQHMCGIAPSRQGLCWGRGQFGQLGGGALGKLGNPVTAVESGTWAQISVSRLATCAVSLNDAGYCWGSNQRGGLGNASISTGSSIAIPAPIDNADSYRAVVPGWLHTCAIATNGLLYCWGDNTNGQLGIGTTDNQAHLEPMIVSFTERFESVALGSRSTCGITVDHRALCWGQNATGQLGDGTITSRALPTLVAGGLKFVAITLGSGFGGGTSVAPPVGGQANAAHTCAITESGAPYCWGWNGDGQLGDGTRTDRRVPVTVQGNLVLTSIGAGGTSTCGMNGNAIWCWGSNGFGQLGNGTAIGSSVPVSAGGPFKP
jgi:alpha-tubulin suppressor-like RCC1 family protein